MDIPPGVAFRAVTDDDTPGAFTRAAAETLSRDAIWNDPPPLADDCEHDLRCLPVVEYRQTVTCAKCGGLHTGLSRELTANPAAFKIYEDGRISHVIAIRRRDPAGAAERMRAAGLPEGHDHGNTGAMTTPPGIRPIDPKAEAARLAREREDPRWREWAVRHPDGKITVRPDGHAYPSRGEADAARPALTGDCEWCPGGLHALAYRDIPPWREAP